VSLVARICVPLVGELREGGLVRSEISRRAFSARAA
jgi:hypothetical protein